MSRKRFVLLEHRWEGVHWDFMLEHGEALRTWAIDRPVVAGVDLPARALPDHRKVYLDYEGEVSGNRGSVRRVDWGVYALSVWEEDRVRVRLEGAQLAGEVELCQVGSADGVSWTFRLGNVD
jgi:DNA polymerase Ligase (LigD)